MYRISNYQHVAVAAVFRIQLLALLLCVMGAARAYAADTPRQIVAKAILTEDSAERRAVIGTLIGQGDESIAVLFTAWREDALFIHQSPEGVKTPVQLVGDKDTDGRQQALRIDDGQLFTGTDGKPLRLLASELTTVQHDRALRLAMRAVIDLLDLAAPSPEKRIRAVSAFGQSQDVGKLSALQMRSGLENDPKVKRALREAIALIQLKSPDVAVKLAALKELRELHTLASTDFIKAAQREAEASQNPELTEAARLALRAVESHRTAVNFFSTIFQGISAGSVLLVVALGLAITFGLMRVINMAHGEMIAIGAYTTYIVQHVFQTGLALSPFGFSIKIPGLNLSAASSQHYFLFALPLSFLTAAIVGILLERSVIRFLYRRPLESLLATWGVSLILQQLMRLIFGANNVNVDRPSYLASSWTLHDVDFGWNRLFVIGSAIVIVVGVWLVLTRTPLGLLMRAVMQNRNMASCMGVRTERVNMMTFGLGSGLAGLAGAFVSQLGNVGPSLGQSYIIESFMTVVVGGVGSIVGSIIAALGIGLSDLSLQQILGNPVLGKICVLIAIILFLQWRPAGLFVTRSRSLDE
jgi:urea transport system permease protein